MAQKGEIYAPASKSYLQRAMAIAALTSGRTVLKNVSWCDDTLIVKDIIQQLGATVRQENRDFIIESGGLNIREDSFFVGESGLALRMFCPVVALSGREVVLNGTGSLKTRPASVIAEALGQLGVDVSTGSDMCSPLSNHYLPIKIRGPLKSCKIEIDGSLTSQVLTGLLIAFPLVKGDSEIKVRNLKSKPYIDMTIEIMNRFGVSVAHHNYQTFFIKGNQKYKPAQYEIEGDWSSAAFLLVAGAISGEVEIANLDYNSKQADKRIVTVLKSAGADVVINNDSVVVRKNNLNAFEFDATDCPDLFPPLACLGASCNGVSIIKGVSRLKHKESNRAVVLKKEFEKIGVRIEIVEDDMKIIGGNINGAVINSNGDHRIAMAAGVMNLVSMEEIVVTDSEVVNKSYPAFFKDVERLGI